MNYHQLNPYGDSDLPGVPWSLSTPGGATINTKTALCALLILMVFSWAPKAFGEDDPAIKQRAMIQIDEIAMKLRGSVERD